MPLRVELDLLDGKLGKSPITGGVFISQSLSFSPSELPHSPTQLTQLPIKSVGACRHGILPLMQTHAHSHVLCLRWVCRALQHICVWMSIQGDIDIWVWRVKHRLHRLNTQTEESHLCSSVFLLSLFLKRFVTSVLISYLFSNILVIWFLISAVLFLIKPLLKRQKQTE